MMQPNHSKKACALVLLGLSAVLLGGCETTGPANPMTELAAYRARAQAEPEKANERPSRAQAAMDCWSMAEKSHAGASIDARGDFVTACIEAKLNGTDVKIGGKPATARAAKPKPEAKTPQAKPPEAKPDSKPKT